MYGLASATGYAFHRIGLPLPWMIGPLVSTAAFGLLGGSVAVPLKTRPFGQVVVATSVGLNFTPAALEAAIASTPILIGLALFTAGLGVGVSWLLTRLTGIDRVTAFLASMPNGPVEMAHLAERYGVDPGPVVFAQTLRIASIVVLVPLGIYLIHGEFAASGGFPAAPFLPGPLLLIAVCGGAAAILFRKLRLSNPYFLGPLAFSAVATAAGAELAHYPVPILALAQILLGTWLGSTFKRELVQRAGRLVTVCIATTLLFVALCTAGAAGLALVTDFSWESLVLGAAPGGVTEMALTAAALHQDVSLITAFHLTRIFLIMPNIPWAIARIHRRALPPDRRT